MNVIVMDILFFSYSIASFFILRRFLNGIFEEKLINKITKLTRLSVIIILAVMSNIFINNLSLSLILGVSFYLIITFVFYEAQFHIKISAAIYFLVFSFASELIAALILSNIFVDIAQNARGNIMFMFVGGLTSKIILIVIVEIVVHLWSSKASKVSIGSWGLIVSIPIVSIGLSLLVVYEPIIKNQYDQVAAIFCFSILYINLVVFYLFDNIIKQVDENNHYKFREDLLHQQEIQYKSIIDSYDQIRKVRHDMLVHLITIDGYINRNEVKNAKNYISNLSDELDIRKGGIISTNVVVDALLNNRKHLMITENIRFESDIAIPTTIDIADMDLSIVLGNLINNGIEANLRGDIKEKYIYLKMRLKNACLFIEMENAYDAESIKKKGPRFISSKLNLNKKSSGLGLLNIKEVINTYSGAFQIDEKDSMFVTKVMMPEQKNEEY